MVLSGCRAEAGVAASPMRAASTPPATVRSESSDGAQVKNFGTIETHGTHAIGIEGIGSHRFPAGENISIVNGGHVITEGNLAIGVALGLPVVPPGTAADS